MRNDYIKKKVDAHKVTYHNQYHDFQHCDNQGLRILFLSRSFSGTIHHNNQGLAIVITLENEVVILYSPTDFSGLT